MDEKLLLSKINELEEKIGFMDFRQNLIFNNTSIDRLIFEYNITREQYQKIMDLMDKYREDIENEKSVNHNKFEREIYSIVPQLEHNYHFVEGLVMTFWENGRWEEVFDTMYRTMDKYKYIKKDI